MYRAYKLQIEEFVSLGENLMKRAPKRVRSRWKELSFEEKLHFILRDLRHVGALGGFNETLIRLSPEIASISDEILWMRRPAAIFPESLQLCEHLMRAKFDIDQFENTLFSCFMLMMPNGLEIDGVKVPGLLVTYGTNLDQIDIAAEVGNSIFDLQFDETHADAVKKRTEPMLTIAYRSPGKKGRLINFRANVLVEHIPTVLAAKTDEEYFDAMGIITHLSALTYEEVSFQRKLFKLVMAMFVYAKAMPDQVKSGLFLKCDSGTVKNVKPKTITISEHFEHSEHKKAETPFYRTWHFATLRHPRYYQGEFQHMEPGSRVVFKRATMVGRETDTLTITEAKK